MILEYDPTIVAHYILLLALYLHSSIYVRDTGRLVLCLESEVGEREHG